MEPFYVATVEYWVPLGWDAAVFGGVLYRRERSRYRPDQWIMVDPADVIGV